MIRLLLLLTFALSLDSALASPPEGVASLSADSSWPPQAPIRHCKYCEPTEDGHFDCDDFGYSYKMWWDANHPGQEKYAWQVAYHGKKNKTEDTGHVMIVIQTKSKNVFNRFCLIEYYDNTEVGCWFQTEATPETPSYILAKVEKDYHLDKGSAYQDEEWNTQVWDSNRWLGSGGRKYALQLGREACFTEYKQSCEMFEKQTGLNCKTFLPLKASKKTPHARKNIRRYRSRHKAK